MVSQDWDFGLIFENSADPQYVIDVVSGRLLAVNKAFAELTGYTCETLLHKDFQPQTLILPSDEDIPQFFFDPNSQERSCSEFMLVTASGRLIDVMTSSRHIANVAHGTIRDITEKQTLLKSLQQKAKKYGAERAKAVKTSVNIGKRNIQLLMQTEQIEKSYELTAKLQHANDENQIFQMSFDILTDRNSFNYKKVGFWMVDGNHLKFTCCNTGEQLENVRLSGNHRFAKALRGEKIKLDVKDGEIIEPLQGFETAIGLLHASSQQNPWELPPNMNIVRNLANAISLTINNMRLYKTVQKQAVEDHLTGLFNRRYFDKKVKDEFERAVRYKRPLSLVMLDIDDFKTINDTMGHEQGNSVLRELGALLKKSKRFSDIACRYGGEEFFLILPETDLANAMKKADKVRKELEKKPFPCLGSLEKSLHITASFGISSLDPTIQDVQELINFADQAQYFSKQHGKNKTSTYQTVEKA